MLLTVMKQNAKDVGVNSRTKHLRPAKMSAIKQMTSDKNRSELHEWYKNSKYCDAKFWISPNVTSSSDETVAEVLNAVRSFDADAEKKTANDTTKL